MPVPLTASSGLSVSHFIIKLLPSSARAAITKHHRWSGQNGGNLSSHSLEAGGPEEVSAGLSRPPPPRVDGGLLHGSAHRLPSLPLCPHFPFLQGYRSYWVRATLLLTQYTCYDPIFKQGPIPRHWGLGLEHVNLGGHSSPHIKDLRGEFWSLNQQLCSPEQLACFNVS